jgi:hypothetical protein
MNRHIKPLLTWWLIFCSVVFATVYSQLSIGLFTTLNDADATKLSFLVIVCFYAYLISLGVRLTKYCKDINDPLCQDNLQKIQKHGWFLSDIFMAFGFLGTLIGFVIMLDLTGLSSANAAQATLITLTTGMKTALYTTVMALIGSIIIKITLYVLGAQLEKVDSCQIKIITEG